MAVEIRKSDTCISAVSEELAMPVSLSLVVVR